MPKKSLGPIPSPKRTNRDIPNQTWNSAIRTSLGLFASFVAVFVSVLQIISTQKQPPLPPSYDAQLKALDQTRIKLQDLIAFIDSQKEQLAASQRAIETLKAEEGQLKPMVEADRKVIDAIFAAEARQYAKEKTRDAIYGFISGVAASLMAAFIWKLIAILAERRRRAEAAA